MKHTPGPWEIVDGMDDFESFAIYGKRHGATDTCIIATVDGMDAIEVDAEEQANARLIAASPDLLEACRELLTASEIIDQSEPPDKDDVEHFLNVCKQARSAISKAEGRE